MINPNLYKFKTFQEWLENFVNREEMENGWLPEAYERPLRPDESKKSPFKWTPASLAGMVGHFIKANLP